MLIDHQPSALPPPDMADKHARSGGKHSVRIVASIPDSDTTPTSSSAPIRKHVTLQPQAGGRLGQSISHTSSDEIFDEHSDIPMLLDVPDDTDDEAMENLANTMEEEFFGPNEQVAPDEKVITTPPVRVHT